MARKEDKNLIVGLDIGTSKVVAHGRRSRAGGRRSIWSASASHPSRGLKKGVVVNIESAVESIQQAVDEAERMAGCRFIPCIPAFPAATFAA
jgi:cell division protein FtsA